MTSDLLFSSKVKCPICSNVFTVMRVRSRLELVRQDKDFNRIYEKINPLYYTIWLCPQCGYASQDNYFDKVSVLERLTLKEFLDNVETKVVFAGLRSCEQAILLFKTAIFYAEMIKASNSRIASLYIRLGWLYREMQDNVMEKLALEKALEYYEKSLHLDIFPIGNMSELTVEYLVYQLYFKTGNTKLAASGIYRMLTNPALVNEKRVLRMARDAWDEIKESNSTYKEFSEMSFVEED